MNQDVEFMLRAIEWSRKGMENENMGPIGAVVARDGVILGEGHNRNRLDMDITAHGEMVAIRNGVKKAGRLDALVGATIYTTAQPCPMCYTACLWAGITRIVYALSCEDTAEVGGAFGFMDSEFYQDLGKHQDQRSIPQTQVLREDALPILREWARLAEQELNQTAE